MGFGPLVQEMLHADNPRSAGVGTLVVTLMRVFLPSLGYSYKTRSLGWWVPGEVPPMIKLGLIGRVKFGVLLEHQSFFPFWMEVEGETERTSSEALGSFHVADSVDGYTCFWLRVVSALLSYGSISLLLHYALLLCCRRCLLVPSGAGYTSIFDPHPLFFPPTVSRAGRMPFASSHSKSRSVELSTHRSRVLSRLFGDSVSMAVVPSSSALGDSGTTDTLVVMRPFFNVDSTVTTRRLFKVRKNYFIPPEYKLHVPLPGVSLRCFSVRLRSTDRCP
ncbi:hypothetical protein GW17_00055168 [Ensete ventricosum]|nr:hypothetical protein GW17_00055168 [Ensete ventricosum]